MKKASIILLLILISLSFGKGIYFLKDGFSFRRIHSLKHQECLGLDSKNILNQTFYYLGRGRQCFAFESEDGNYVLKFPRTDIYSTPFWVKVLPVRAYRKKLEAMHAERERFIRESFRISYEHLKEETGLIAVHLGESEPTKQLLEVVDAAGSTHHLPLFKTSFILQEKHPLLMQAYRDARARQDTPKAEKILDALLDVIVKRARMGILNRDRSFLRNYGFDGEKAFQIDVGSFFRPPCMDSHASYQKSVRDSTDPVQEWLQQHDPEMLPYLNKKLDLILNFN